MLTKIVHCMRDCVGIIAGVQHIDDPFRSNIGGPDPCDPCGVDAYVHRTMTCYSSVRNYHSLKLYDKICSLEQVENLGFLVGISSCPPPPNSGKIFFGQLCKIRAFFREKHVKFGNLIKFSGKYHKNSRIPIIFLTRIT